METHYQGYKIKYFPHPGDWSGVAQVKVYDANGQEVGSMGMSGMSQEQQDFFRTRYKSESKTSNFAHINWAEIEPEHRGKGIYKKMLDLAVKGVKSQGSDGVSTVAQTSDSKRVWERITNKVVHSPEPGAAQPVTTLNDSPKYAGKHMNVRKRIAQLEKKLALNFEDYKKEHPGTHLTPSSDEFIGKTKSGKPVHSHFEHPDHEKFSAHDHLDAAQVHINEGKSGNHEHHKAQAKKHINAAEKQALDTLSLAGE